MYEPSSPQNFAAAARLYLDWYSAEHRDRPSTWRRVAVSFVSLTTAFGQRPIQTIAPRDLEAFKSHRRLSVKAVTVRHDLHALSGFFQYGIQQEWLSENPVRMIKVPSDRDAVRIRVLSDCEQTEYLRAAESHPALSAIARLMLSTGMRPGEVLALRAGDLDKGCVIVRQGKTAAARRAIRLCGEAAELTTRLAEGRRPQDFLLPGCAPGRHLEQIHGAHLRACRRAGVQLCLYDFRHTFATRMAEKGMPLPTLAAILGHNGLRCVMRYIHVNQAAMDEAMARFSG